VLDGIHEDLNRVKVKESTESVNGGEGKPDFVVAKVSW